jgi:hypothetical protein
MAAMLTVGMTGGAAAAARGWPRTGSPPPAIPIVFAWRSSWNGEGRLVLKPDFDRPAALGGIAELCPAGEVFWKIHRCLDLVLRM